MVRQGLEVKSDEDEGEKQGKSPGIAHSRRRARVGSAKSRSAEVRAVEKTDALRC